MGPGSFPRLSYPRDRLPLLYLYALLNQIRLIVCIDGYNILRVSKDNQVPISFNGVPGIDDPPMACSLDRSSDRGADIDSLMSLTLPLFKDVCKLSSYRPDEMYYLKTLLLSFSLARCHHDVVDVDLDLQDLLCPGDKNPLTHVDPAGIRDPIYGGYLVGVHSVGLANAIKGLVFLDHMVNPLLLHEWGGPSRGRFMGSTGVGKDQYRENKDPQGDFGQSHADQPLAFSSMRLLEGVEMA